MRIAPSFRLLLLPVLMTALLAAFPAAWAAAQEGPPQPDEAAKSAEVVKPDPVAALLEQVAEAYRQTKQYAGRIEFVVEQTQPRKSEVSRQTFFVRFDRESQSLLLDRLDYQLLIEDGVRRFQHEQLPGRFMETELEKLTPQSLFAGLRVGRLPLVPELDMLLLVDPNALGELGIDSKSAVVSDGDAGKLLTITNPRGRMTMTFDSRTHLAREVRFDLAADQMPPGHAAAVIYRIHVERHNEPLAEDAFAFDASGEAFDNWQAYSAPPGNARNADMLGKAAPAVDVPFLDGKPYSLAKDTADVIVLDFWATWCPPCRKTLPIMQSLHDWAAKEGKSVKVYAINVAETPEKIAEHWKAESFTMPVLLDKDRAISRSFGVTGIPHTVIIANGKVHNVHVGYHPELEDRMRGQIEDLLAAAAKKSGDSDTGDDTGDTAEKSDDKAE